MTALEKPCSLEALFGKFLSYTASGNFLSETTIRNLEGKSLFIILACRLVGYIQFWYPAELEN